MEDARTQTKRVPFNAYRGNKRRSFPISSARKFCFRHGEMIMSTKIMMALLAAVFACASLALAQGDGNRDNEYATKSAQYCVPQYDNPDPIRIFC
jgi:hypothetical protein